MIAREQHSSAYEVSPALVAFEDLQAMLISAAETALAEAASGAARAETAHAMRNAMRVRKGERRDGQVRDRKGEQDRREALEPWFADRGSEWDREAT